MGLGMVLNRNRQVPAEDSPAFGAIAERFRRAGDLERAVALCQEGLAKFPGHMSARVTLGWSYLDLGKYDEARAELEQVLKRAPDNLAAIRGLAELHDRAEHDEMAAMHRDGSKWMTEAAAAAAAAPEPPAVAPVETRPAAPVVMAAQPTPAPATPAKSEAPASFAGSVDDELEAGIAALGAFAKPGATGFTAPPAPAAPAATTSFAAPTTAAPAAPSQARAAASSFAAPSKPEAVAPVITRSTPVIEASAEDTSPWQPVQIESAAAHLLAASSSPWQPHVEPVKAVVPDAPVRFEAEPEVAFASPTFGEAVAEQDATDLHADAIDFQEFAEFADLADVAPATPAPEFAMPAPAPVASAPARPAAASGAADLAAMAPVAADTPTLIQPRVPSLEELDPALPALVEDSWSEQQDVYVLPAAVEAARATADEGPGPWPPVIAEDPVEAPMAAFEAQPALVAPTPIRRPSLNALNKFLRRVETRRSAVVAEYLAG